MLGFKELVISMGFPVNKHHVDIEEVDSKLVACELQVAFIMAKFEHRMGFKQLIAITMKNVDLSKDHKYNYSSLVWYPSLLYYIFIILL